MFTKRLLQLCLFVSFSATSLFAQAGIGGIAGVVRDPSGSTIPEADVLIINESKGYPPHCGNHGRWCFQRVFFGAGLWLLGGGQ